MISRIDRALISKAVADTLESCHVRRLDRGGSMLLVLWFLGLVAGSFGSFLYSSWETRSLWSKRPTRVIGILRIGRLYLLDIERMVRKAIPGYDLKKSLLFRRSTTKWLFSLRF
jgi:hypothetical protein